VPYGEFSEPGSGSNDLGLSLIIAFDGGALLRATAYENSLSDDNLQAIVNALAAVPGLTAAVFRDGQVSQRSMVPTRAYTPAEEEPQN